MCSNSKHNITPTDTTICYDIYTYAMICICYMIYILTGYM